MPYLLLLEYGFSMELTEKQYLAISTLKECTDQLQKKNSNVVLELLPQGNQTIVYEWEHYPNDSEVQDKINNTQYYYHTHPSHDPLRLLEHGHFHVFLRRNAFSKTAVPLLTSEKHRLNPEKDNLSHLIAIAMNNQGSPVALFTLNHWVTQGLWYCADDMINAFSSFVIKEESYPLTNQWLSALIQLFQPQIIELLKKRDEIIQEWQIEHLDSNAWTDKKLEVTSLTSLIPVEEAA